jgi:hypothetical protein
MLGDLSPDIIGTDPKYIPIVNQEWLTPDKNTYDNYPSDNNSVRIQPKLGDMWNNHIETGINLVPNSVSTMPCHSAGMSKEEVKASVIREAKKAMMVGLSGAQLAEHIRSRFAAEDIVQAKDELTKLSEEQGLLGNVYIDATAFVNATEAEQFLNQHRTRLARFIVVGEGAVSKSAAHFLANKFHKNVVTAMEYNEDVFTRYKMHLVEAKKVDHGFVIDSKETLRAAFMAQPMERQSNFVPNRKKEYSEEEVLRSLSADTEKMATEQRLAQEELTFKHSLPIISFVREQMSKGKEVADLKEMLRGKYATEDLQGAAKYLKLVANESVFTAENMDKLAEEDKITLKMAKTLKNLIKEFPIHHAEFVEETPTQRTVGVKASLHAMGEKKALNSELCQSAVDMLRKGKEMDEVREEVLGKVTAAEANTILAHAIQEFNEAPAGVMANAPVVVPKEKVVPDLPELVTLPSPDTILSKAQEVADFYKGANTDIEIDPTGSADSMDIELSGGSEGLDIIL